MSRDGAGNYTLPSGNPVTTNTPISSTVQNNTMNDVAAALTSSLAKDGQTVPTNHLPMGGFKHTGVANGVAATDYAALGQVQSGSALVAAAAGTADALTGAFAPAVTALTAGLTLIVRAASANATTTPTFKADGTAAKTIVKGNNLPLVAGDIAGAGHWLMLTYDATLGVWVLGDPAAGLGVTPPQFDNSTKLATTAFAKRMGMELNSQFLISSTATLDVSHVGRRITVNTSGITVTLPLASSVPDGAVIILGSVVTTGLITIARQGTDVIETLGNSMTLAPGEQIILSSDHGGSGVWLRAMDSTNAGFNIRNPATIGATISQPLPSGLIIKSGTFSTGSIASGSFNNGTFTFPVAFPTSCITAFFNPSNNSAANLYGGSYGVPSAASAAWFANNTAGIAQTGILSYLAVGY